MKPDEVAALSKAFVEPVTVKPPNAGAGVEGEAPAEPALWLEGEATAAHILGGI